MKTALITGIAGQDGAYLAHYLTRKGYKVYGVARRNKSLANLKKLFVPIEDKFPDIIYADITEAQRVISILSYTKPDEIYNLAAQSHVGYSFDNPHLTMDVNYGGLINFIDGVKKLGLKTRIYQASTSELFGYNDGLSLNEETPFTPKSPYAIAKLAAHWAGINARKEGIFVSNGILFNHESPLRGEDFVTRKITIALGKIMRGESHVLELGNIHAARDWGFAGDYVRAMHLMLDHEEPDDFVIGTGEVRSVAHFLLAACEEWGIHPTIEGTGANEKWYDQHGKLIMQISDKFYRPNEVHTLLADASKANAVLGWRPEVSFEKLVKMMVENDR